MVIAGNGHGNGHGHGHGNIVSCFHVFNFLMIFTFYVLLVYCSCSCGQSLALTWFTLTLVRRVYLHHVSCIIRSLLLAGKNLAGPCTGDTREELHAPSPCHQPIAFPKD